MTSPTVISSAEPMESTRTSGVAKPSSGTDETPGVEAGSETHEAGAVTSRDALAREGEAESEVGEERPRGPSADPPGGLDRDDARSFGRRPGRGRR